jgi:hypothetical protein
MEANTTVSFKIDDIEYPITWKDNPRLYSLIKNYHKILSSNNKMPVRVITGDGRMIVIELDVKLSILEQMPADLIHTHKFIYNEEEINPKHDAISMQIYYNDYIEAIRRIGR